MIRASTWTGCLLPSGWTCRSCNARRSFACVGRGRLTISSRKASAVCQLELPLLSLMGPRERALLVAEELRLDQGVRDRAAVDSDKRLLASGAQMMDRPSDEFLARAGLALDEDSERGVGHLLDLLDDLLHLTVRAHQ